MWSNLPKQRSGWSKVYSTSLSIIANDTTVSIIDARHSVIDGHKTDKSKYLKLKGKRLII